MPINQLDSNGKSKIISHKTGVMGTKGAGLSDKAGSSAPSHSKAPIVNLGHASYANTGMTKKVVSDRGTGGKGAKGSY